MTNWLDLPREMRHTVLAMRDQLEDSEVKMWQEVLEEYEDGFFCTWDFATKTYILLEKSLLPFPLHLKPCKEESISKKEYEKFMRKGFEIPYR